MEEQDINVTELQLICDKVSEELLDNLSQTNLTVGDNHYFELKALLNAVRKQINIPEWYPVFGPDHYSRKQNVFNEIQRLLHSRGIAAKPFVIEFLKKVFGEKYADFEDL